MGKEGTNGSELHRLKKFENLDEARFNRLYKKCLPLIKKLSYNIDTRKYGVMELMEAKMKLSEKIKNNYRLLYSKNYLFFFQKKV